VGRGPLQKNTGCPISICSGPRKFLYFGPCDPRPPDCLHRIVAAAGLARSVFVLWRSTEDFSSDSISYPRYLLTPKWGVAELLMNRAHAPQRRRRNVKKLANRSRHVSRGWHHEMNGPRKGLEFAQ
jgi:hypothetical protein